MCEKLGFYDADFQSDKNVALKIMQLSLGSLDHLDKLKHVAIGVEESLHLHLARNLLNLSHHLSTFLLQMLSALLDIVHCHGCDSIGAGLHAKVGILLSQS